MVFNARQKSDAFYCLTVPAFIPIEQPIESDIDAGEFIFFQFQLPLDGMTIQLQQQRGSVTLYGSFDIQNPNSAFHSFRIESSGDMFIPLGDSDQPQSADRRRSKRTVKRIAEDESSREFSDRTLFVSIEGEQDFSSFILETTFGDTCKLSQKFVALLQVLANNNYAIIIHTAGASTHLMSVGLLLSLLTLFSC